MRVAPLLVLIGCSSRAPQVPLPAAAPPPAPAPAVLACPPIGHWTLEATVRSCETFIRSFAIDVVPGGPSPDHESITMAADQIAASGRTNTGQPYDTLLVVSQPTGDADHCSMQLALEYLGPHEMLLYRASVAVEAGRLAGTGTYAYSIEDCEEPRRCTCDSDLRLTGAITPR